MKDDRNLREMIAHGTFFFPLEHYYCCIPDTLSLLPLHWHEEMEITLVQEGSCIYHVDLHSHPIKQGDFVIVSPHMLHGITPIEGQVMSSDSFVFSLNMLGHDYPDSCTTKFLHPITKQKLLLPAIIKTDHPAYAALHSIFEGLLSCYTKQEYAFELEMKALLFQFLHQLIIFTDIPEDKKQGNEEIMDKIKTVLQYIQTNYQSPISIAELADLCHFSTYYFMRFFKKHTNMTCIEYINSYRLSKSLEQLENSSLSVTEIALENGFNNISYFNRQFKKRFGITPKEYRTANS